MFSEGSNLDKYVEELDVELSKAVEPYLAILYFKISSKDCNLKETSVLFYDVHLPALAKTLVEACFTLFLCLLLSPKKV